MRYPSKPLVLATISFCSLFTSLSTASALGPRDRKPTTAEPAPTQKQASSTSTVAGWTGIDLQPALQNREARFAVRAVGFTAVDESGVDWLGSDEVYSVWSSNGTTSGTLVYGDIDSGDFQAYHPAQTCIYPMTGTFNDGRSGESWTCWDGGGSAPISFSVSLYEDDDFSIPACFSTGISPAPECEDDFLGGHDAEWTEEELLQILPTENTSREFTVRLFPCENREVCGTGHWDADYDFHYTIIRLNDKVTPMQAFADFGR